ncbi:S41 family peptidase [Brevibacillus ruminantium]|uniref:S41 family peptidase n=1 Tax=Brevibacillus ruminantium TaxID=2950604 RepID=A0ABY4W9J6_9BACL|nr:S41 family peptidase [Brevibacillus ruminantium]USG63840.1 S41 family peptidase [Brevibacillus ruminantium]
MKRILSWLLAAGIALGGIPVHAAADPFVETVEVYHQVLDNHLSRPNEKQLVQGALEHVQKLAKEAKNVSLSLSQDDDTLSELIQRLTEWKEKSKLDEATINRGAIEGMLATLDDPHTMFFTKKELNSFQAGVENQLVGFGFRLRFQNGLMLVREIIPQTPAAASGLKKGDQLIGVDGTSLKEKTAEDAFNFLRGEEGTEAVLTVYRPSEKRELQIKLKRAAITVPEVEGNLFQDDKIGYISLETFGSEAAYQFRDKLDQLTRESPSLKGLIVDLRDNSGGYLTSARDVASLFFQDGLLMYTTNRNGVEVQTWVRNGRNIHYPVRILVNEGTASASELLAGALRDHGIAKLVGTKTYGKGSAQQIIPLSDGDALKITLNEYFTPNHTKVNHIGLEPDVVEQDYAAQVIRALHSLGVTSFQLEAEDGDTVINGIAFAAVDPIFKKDEKGNWLIRGQVLSSLLGKEKQGEADYVEIDTYLKTHPTLQMKLEYGAPVITYHVTTTTTQ